MSNIPKSSNQDMNELIRPRSVYISTDDVEDFSDSSSFKVNLQQQITAEDGYDLVWGLRSIGINATANNICTRLKNNSILCRLTYTPAEFIPGGAPDTWIVNPSVDNIVVERVIYFPDGLYNSLDDLFDMLSNTNEQNYIFPSGYYIDRNESQQSFRNIVPINLLWKRSSGGGFTIAPQDNSTSIKNDYEDVVSNIHYRADQVSQHLIQIVIAPNQLGGTTENNKLWFKLFYNTESTEKNVPPSVAPPNYRTGINPPNGIAFNMIKSIPTTATDSWTPFSEIVYSVVEIGNEGIYNDYIGNYPNPELTYYSLPYRSYFTPILHPLYIDFTSSLSSLSMTKEGFKKGILLRQFINGGDNGVTSFYQHFDSPVWNIVESPVLSSIDIDLSSQSDLWDFYNMSFVIEFMFFEVEKEQLKSVDQVAYLIPPTDNVQEAIRHRFQSKFPFQQSGEHSGVYLLDDSTKLKKRRR
jgi:hypothetical protein